MELRRLGQTDLKVAPLCLGGNVFGWTADERDSFAVLDAYVDAGGNFIDTAESYSRWVPGHHGGESEAVIGRWLAARKQRDRIVIATKVGAPMGDAPAQKGLTRQRIRDAVEGSLKRLGIEAIDLYQAHFDDPETSLEETLETFDQLVREGKVRHLGASNYKAPRLASALAIAERHHWRPYECLQPEYNLMDRDEYERELEPTCREHHLGVITYYSLAAGFLSGKYRPDRPLPDSPRAQNVQRLYMNPRGFRVLGALDRVAARLAATPAQIALAWVMARPSVTAAIASATDAQQAGDLARAMALHLDAEAMRELDQASATQGAVPERHTH